MLLFWVSLFMLSVVLLSTIMLSVVMQSFVMLRFFTELYKLFQAQQNFGSSDFSNPQSLFWYFQNEPNFSITVQYYFSMLSWVFIMLSVGLSSLYWVLCNAKCHCDKCHCAKCQNAKSLDDCHYAWYHDAAWCYSKCHYAGYYHYWVR